MAAYLLLVVYIIFLPIVSAFLIRDNSKRQRFILWMGMMAIFLLLALKKETVGSDIVGYKREYLHSASMSWKNTGYMYFEAGFIQLMKLFSKLHIPFQVFTAMIYAVCCNAYYRFIKKYSTDVTLSLLIFVCYQFLVFHISGLRQSLAMAICIYAFLLYDSSWRHRWMRLAASIVIVLLAAMIHQSAMLFLAVLAFIQWKPQKVHWMMMLVAVAASVFMRPLVLQFINLLFGRSFMSSKITLGGNFIFLLGLSVFCVIASYQRKVRQQGLGDFFPVATNVLMMAVAAQLILSGSSLLRGAMYLTLFLIPGIPCALKCFDRRTELLLSWALGLFFIILFWTDTLSINQLDMCPYLFFWQ